MLVECEPRRLEADDRLVAFAECWGSVSHDAKPYRWSRVITRTPQLTSRRCRQHSRPFLIGVAGGTCAGKTVVCERLVERAGESQVALIRLDSYQVDHTHQSDRRAGSDQL